MNHFWNDPRPQRNPLLAPLAESADLIISLVGQRYNQIDNLVLLKIQRLFVQWIDAVREYTAEIKDGVDHEELGEEESHRKVLQLLRQVSVESRKVTRLLRSLESIHPQLAVEVGILTKAVRAAADQVHTVANLLSKDRDSD